MPNFNGLWTIRQQLQAIGASVWPSKPGAPTIGTASQASTTSISVTFTAPTSDGNLPITGYRATATGGITATGSSSPIVITGLTTGNTYTVTVAAQNSAGYGAESAASNSVTLNSQTYTNRVTFSYTGSDQSWTVPAGVQNLRVVAWGAGGTGGGNGNVGGAGGNGLGGLAIDCGVAVTVGESLTIRLGQAVSYSGTTGSCFAQSSGYGGSGSSSSGAGGTGDTGGSNGNSGGSGGGSSAVVRSGTILCAAGGGGGGGGAAWNANGADASVATGGTGGTKTGNGVNGSSGTGYSGGGGGGGSGSSAAGNPGGSAGTGGGNLVPSLPSGYPYAQNSYTPSGQTPGNSADSDRSGAGVGGNSGGGGGQTNGNLVIYY